MWCHSHVWVELGSHSCLIFPTLPATTTTHFRNIHHIDLLFNNYNIFFTSYHKNNKYKKCGTSIYRKASHLFYNLYLLFCKINMYYKKNHIYLQQKFVYNEQNSYVIQNYL